MHLTVGTRVQSTVGELHAYPRPLTLTANQYYPVKMLIILSLVAANTSLGLSL